MPKSDLTPRTAARHEALYPRLATLLRQIEAIALRKPGAPVPSATQTIAEALLFDAQAFGVARKTLVATAADMAGLAAQLGQALAALDAFEAAHSGWDAEFKCFVWQMANGDSLPIARRRLQPVKTPRPAEKRQASKTMRHKIAYMIDAKFSEGYQVGYDDAKNLRPERDVSRRHIDRI